jgi:hypothetical protein
MNLYCKIDLTPLESGVFDREVEISTEEDEE